MEQLLGWYHSTFGQSKVTGDVGVSLLRDNLGATHRILFVLVDVRVERGEIIIFYLLFLGLVCQMVQFDCVGPPATERVSRLQRLHELQLIHKRFYLLSLLFIRVHSHSQTVITL